MPKKKYILIFIADFEKAFDKIDWGFITRCLKFFHFGDSLIEWVKMMYKGSVCKVLNNGHLSKPIPLGRGVKQGCPLSPYLSIIAIEILKIRSNEKIRGLELNGINNKVSMYADYSSFMLEQDNTSLQTLFLI